MISSVPSTGQIPTQPSHGLTVRSDISIAKHDVERVEAFGKMRTSELWPHQGRLGLLLTTYVEGCISSGR